MGTDERYDSGQARADGRYGMTTDGKMLDRHIGPRSYMTLAKGNMDSHS